MKELNSTRFTEKRRFDTSDTSASMVRKLSEKLQEIDVKTLCEDLGEIFSPLPKLHIKQTKTRERSIYSYCQSRRITRPFKLLSVIPEIEENEENVMSSPVNIQSQTQAPMQGKLIATTMSTTTATTTTSTTTTATTTKTSNINTGSNLEQNGKSSVATATDLQQDVTLQFYLLIQELNKVTQKYKKNSKEDRKNYELPPQLIETIKQNHSEQFRLHVKYLKKENKRLSANNEALRREIQSLKEIIRSTISDSVHASVPVLSILSNPKSSVYPSISDFSISIPNNNQFNQQRTKSVSLNSSEKRTTKKLSRSELKKRRVTKGLVSNRH